MLSSLCFVRWPFCLFRPLCSALVPLLHCLFGVFEAPFSVSGSFQSEFFFLAGGGGLDEMRCESPCVGRIGAIWEVVLFFVVSGWFGVSSGSPLSGCLGERAVPFQLCQIGWCLRGSFRVVSFLKEFARVPPGTIGLFCGFVLLRISRFGPCTYPFFSFRLFAT